MSLTTSLQIGRSALLTSQVGLQVAGDNLANAATPGYHRRAINLSPISGGLATPGFYNGLGVRVDGVTRRVDEALEARLRDAISHQQSAVIDYDVLSQIESLTNHLSDLSLDNRLDEFFNAFSELANSPTSLDARTLIVEQGAALASHMRELRADLSVMSDAAEARLEVLVERANELTAKLGEINAQITAAEQTGAQDPALRDQRDLLLSELSQLMDISVSEQPEGSVEIFVGSSPLLLSNQPRVISLETLDAGSGSEVLLSTGEPGEFIRPSSGSIGALLSQRNGVVAETISDLDNVASALIVEVNRLHSQGVSSPGMTVTLSDLRFDATQRTMALNDPTNLALSALPMAPGNGSIEIVVTDQATGIQSTTVIEIDLDGIDNAGAPGYADDTTLQDIVDAINASAPNLTAQITSAGQLQIDADPGFEFGFASDSSGVLAAVGVNTFFTGASASDIGVRDELRDQPQFVVAGLLAGSNERALAIAQLRDNGVETLGGSSIQAAWRQTTDRIAVVTNAAITRRDATAQVRESLQAQRDAISGVSVDEESINLMTHQRQFQAAARLIATIDELTQTLISLV